jgi:hypothetical protein
VAGQVTAGGPDRHDATGRYVVGIDHPAVVAGQSGTLGMPAQVGDLHAEVRFGSGGERPGCLVFEHAPVQGLVVGEEPYPEQPLAERWLARAG